MNIAQDKSGAESILYCSFCGKSQAAVKKLFVGPSVYICNECVDLCRTEHPDASLSNDHIVRDPQGDAWRRELHYVEHENWRSYAQIVRIDTECFTFEIRYGNGQHYINDWEVAKVALLFHAQQELNNGE